MIKILFLTSHLNSGGITSYLLTLCKGLRKKGYEVGVCSNGGNQESHFEQLGVALHKCRLKIKSEAHPLLWMQFPKIKKIVLENHYQLIHSQTRVTQVLATVLTNQIENLMHIATAHGFFKSRFSRKLFPCWGEHTIAISHAVESHVKQNFGIKPKDMTIIYNGINLDRFKPIHDLDQETLQRKFNLPTQQPLVGMVARLSTVKGQDIFIKALSILNRENISFHGVLAGEGKWESSLRKLIQQEKLKNKVTFLPYQKEVEELYNLLDVFVAPSRMEGLGISIMEAQASGLPVVASKIGGIPELITHFEDGILVQPENEHELAQAIRNLLENEVLDQTLSDNSLQKAQQYSDQLMIDKTIEVYERITKRP